MIINTNIQALKTSNILNESNKMLFRVTGSIKLWLQDRKPKDDAAGLAVSSPLEGSNQ